MTVDGSTFTALIDMGIEPFLARAAANRFHTVEPAVNWCFGEGMDWKPEVENEAPPSYANPNVDSDRATVQHREVIDPTPLDKTPPRTPPPMPPRPNTNYSNLSQSTTPLKSNNPFLHVPPTSQNDPGDDDDEELRKALAMSKEEVDGEARQERERSVRASGAPPPSPEEVGQGGLFGPLFGPSERVDEEGKMAMVPASQAPNQSGAGTSKEDEDLNRAIQDSLMTASFHSASAPRDSERLNPIPRQSGAPLVLYSESGRSTYAATFLQGLLAIPQIRESVLRSMVPESDADDYDTYSLVRDLVEKQESSQDSFVEVDDLLGALRNGSEPGQLPPDEPTQRMHDRMIFLLEEALVASQDQGTADREGASDDYWTQPMHLFHSKIDSDQPGAQRATYVLFFRQPTIPPDLQSSLASTLWTPESPGQSIEVLSDVLTVKLGWRAGAPRELWKLEERVVLDRFLKENAGWSMQIRAEQAVAAGNMKRLRERIDGLTLLKGQNVHDSIRTLIKHYESSSAPEDEVQTQSRRDMKAKLEKTLAVLQAKSATIEEELEVEKNAAEGGLFQTDDPAYQRHVYVLRAVLFHTGALVLGKHLYVYIRSDDGLWWRVQEHEAVAVDWGEVRYDRTGLFMDGGAYLLLYSREGPRLTPPATEGGEEQGGEQGKTNEEMGNVEAAGSGDTLIDLEEGMNIGRGMDAEGAGGEKGIAEAVGEVRGLLGENTKGDVEERSRGDDDRDGEGVEEMETAEKSTAVGHAEVEKSEKSESKAGGGGMDLIM